MLKKFLPALCFTLVMGMGLIYSYRVVGLAFGQEGFDQAFLPIQAFLALVPAILWCKNRQSYPKLQTPRIFPLYWLLVGPVLLAGVYSIGASIGSKTPWVLSLITALLVAIGEEIVYRGLVFQGLLKDQKRIVAIVLSGLAFSLLHAVNPLGGMALNEVGSQLVTTFFLGLFQANLVLQTGSLVIPILYHTAWNFVISADGLPGSLNLLFLFAVTILQILLGIWMTWQMRSKRQK